MSKHNAQLLQLVWTSIISNVNCPKCLNINFKSLLFSEPQRSEKLISRNKKTQWRHHDSFIFNSCRHFATSHHRLFDWHVAKCDRRRCDFVLDCDVVIHRVLRRGWWSRSGIFSTTRTGRFYSCANFLLNSCIRWTIWKPVGKQSSSRELDFFNPRSQLDSTVVTYLSMQLKNGEDR